LIILAAAAAGVARADDDPSHAEATRLSELGAEALQRGEFKIALHDFQSAYALFPSPKLRYNMALAEDGIGDEPAEALGDYRLFLGETEATPPEQRDYATKRIGELSPQVGHLAIDGAAGVVVSVDGHDVGPAPQGDLVVDPGDHRIEQTGRAATSVHVAQGGRASVHLAELVVSHPAGHPITKRWWFWGAVGTVTVATVATIIQVATTPRVPTTSLGNFKAIP
jgi:hypothetical protein